MGEGAVEHGRKLRQNGCDEEVPMRSTDSRTEETRSLTGLPESLPVAFREATAPPSAAPRFRADTRSWLQDQVDGRLGVAVGVAWIVLLQIAFALEPRTNHHVPVIGLLLEITMYALLATMVTGLVMQRRFGLVASLGAAVLATAASIACPVTGHHSFGAWWFGQMACVLALVGISVAALHRSNATS
jgi:hypothetical protein